MNSETPAHGARVAQPSAGGVHARETNNVMGGLAMCAAMVVLTCNEAFVKVATETLPIGEVLALRSFIGMLILLPITIARHAMRPLTTLRSPPFALRIVAEAGGAMMYVYALAHLAMADVASIVQVAPLAMLAVGALFLGEHVGWRRWLAAGAGFAGVLLIIRPGTPAFDWAALFALGSVGFLMVRDTATRLLDRSLPTLFVAFVTMAAVGVLASFFALFEQWTLPSSREFLLLLGSAISHIGFYLLSIYAFRIGETSVVSPFRYTKMIWALVAGLIVFGAFPDNIALFGIAIILLSGMYALYRENKLRRVARRPEIGHA